MAIFIKKCCVCGNVYDKRRGNSTKAGENEEIISHGYCCDDCATHRHVYIIDFNGDESYMNGHLTGDRLYVNQTFVDKFIKIAKKVDKFCMMLCSWDNNVGVYSSEEILDRPTKPLAYSEARDMAIENNILVMV